MKQLNLAVTYLYGTLNEYCKDVKYKDPVKLTRQLAVCINNWLSEYSEEEKQIIYEDIIDHPVSGLSIKAYRQVLKIVPKEFPNRNRLQGNMLFELCKIMHYKLACELLS